MRNRNDRLTRREAIRMATGTGLHTSPFVASADNPIVAENRKEGTKDWQLTRVRYDSEKYRSPFIEGYCSKQSVKAGETLDIMVSVSTHERFKLEIFRTGYYSGRGARLMKTYEPLEGFEQPTPEPGPNNIHECFWKPSVSLTIPDDWLSGVYLGRLTTLPDSAEKPYWQSYVIFIVTDDRPADMLFQCSDNTWQAYNKWPSNYSLYTHPKGVSGPWAHVSFNRPYGRQGQFTSVVNCPLSFGSGEFIALEQPFSYFLEQHGYDVTYCANVDMITPDRGLRCKAFLSVGHDEYWDIRQYRSVEKMRDEGVSLLFFSGNVICYVTPFLPDSRGNAKRTIFRGGPYGGDYKYAVRSNERAGPFPERGPDEGYLIGARNVRPITGGGDWIITKPEHWIFEGTGVKKGDRIRGLVGWEYMGDPPPMEGLEVVAEGTAWGGGERPQQWQSTIYPGPRGNIVFCASTIFWAQGLSMPPGHMLPWSHWSRPHGPDPRVQRITHNLLKRAISVPSRG